MDELQGMAPPAQGGMADPMADPSQQPPEQAPQDMAQDPMQTQLEMLASAVVLASPECIDTIMSEYSSYRSTMPELQQQPDIVMEIIGQGVQSGEAQAPMMEKPPMDAGAVDPAMIG
jgi:hypothetical protein